MGISWREKGVLGGPQEMESVRGLLIKKYATKKIEHRRTAAVDYGNDAFGPRDHLVSKGGGGAP